MRKIIMLAALVSCFVVGCRSEQERIQGEWELAESAGLFSFGLRGYLKDDRDELTFDGDRFTFLNNIKSPERVVGTYALDLTRNPKEITFHFGDRTVVGIFSLSGGNLIICVGEDDKVPPKVFDGGPSERLARVTYRRTSAR